MAREALAKVIRGWSRAVKNWIGSKNGFTTCPNCGDSLWWKPTGGIQYDSDFPCSRAISICFECLQNPASLNTDKIAEELKNSYTKLSEMEKIKAAINNYKNGIRSQTSFPFYF